MKTKASQLFLSTVRKRWVKISFILISALLLLYCMLLNYTEPTELGIARNEITGKTWAQETGGWKITYPWVLVSTIDTRPMRVAVLSSGHGYCAKLVQFKKEKWRDFIATEGFRYYWWANRFSFNSGYDEEYRGMRDIMRGYAFSVIKYPFIEILANYQQ